MSEVKLTKVDWVYDDVGGYTAIVDQQEIADVWLSPSVEENWCVSMRGPEDEDPYIIQSGFPSLFVARGFVESKVMAAGHGE